MAFRDDNEALQAKVKRLQEELGEAKGTIAHLRGAADFAQPELLPSRPRGFSRRVRAIEGLVGEDTFGAMEQLLQSGDAPMETRYVEGTLYATSASLKVTVLPGEGAELLLVFDEAPLASYLPGILFFAFMSLGALGGVQEGEPLGALAVFLVGVFVGGALAYSSKRKNAMEQERREKLFAGLLTFMENQVLRARVSEEEDEATAPEELPAAAEEAPLTAER